MAEQLWPAGPSATLRDAGAAWRDEVLAQLAEVARLVRGERIKGGTRRTTPVVGRGGTDREPLPLTEWLIDTLYGADLPVIAVDVANRLDVADLRRAGEAGNGLTGTTAWSAELQRTKAILALDISISSPVHCRFRVQFALPEHRHLVLTIIRAQLTVITVSPIGDDRLWEDERALPFTIPDYQNIVKNAVATVDRWGKEQG